MSYTVPVMLLHLPKDTIASNSLRPPKLVTLAAL